MSTSKNFSLTLQGVGFSKEASDEFVNFLVETYKNPICFDHRASRSFLYGLIEAINDEKNYEVRGPDTVTGNPITFDVTRLSDEWHIKG